jgi:hypothetical protein
MIISRNLPLNDVSPGFRNTPVISLLWDISE